ncbi:hypothetical protein SLEP1_g41384 [Rubroshorea leprosula]|uniref:Uncharacterized protein n=1 Tax=Rubroshorea leprosula TaxID=152421 RepID=A0AAV5L6L9_9ROSI|nr:hypothetical protein SLEP1_g41384 [Rubroshorea leprosula]
MTPCFPVPNTFILMFTSKSVQTSNPLPSHTLSCCFTLYLLPIFLLVHHGIAEFRYDFFFTIVAVCLFSHPSLLN